MNDSFHLISNGESGWDGRAVGPEFHSEVETGLERRSEVRTVAHILPSKNPSSVPSSTSGGLQHPLT